MLGIVVKDLESRNGTFINDVPVQGEATLKPGDVLRIGPMVFQLLPRPAEATAPDTRSTSKPWNGSGTIISPHPRHVLNPPLLPCELPCSNWHSYHPR